MSGRGQGRGLAALAASALDLSTAPAVEDREAPAATAPVASPDGREPADPVRSAPADVQETSSPDVAPASPPVGEPETVGGQSKARRVSGRSAGRSGAVRSVPAPATQETPADGPRYLKFEPKTVRLTADQADELTQVEARLRRAARGKRRSGDELLSWNMVARAGIDLVLREAAAGRLSGLTENELRASIGLDPLDL